jgi:hypothetical protein
MPDVFFRAALVASILTALMAGCNATITPLPSPSATPIPSSAPITAANLSGNWIFGSANEPARGPVSTCNPFQLWQLSQNNSTLSGNVESCLGPCAAFTEKVSGTNQNGQVQLSGEGKTSFDASPTPVNYQLVFNAQTQHLTGTRNGQPFWAAPYVTPPSCGPQPL